MRNAHDPAVQIATWLEVIERTHFSHRDDTRVLERLRDYYHGQHVIQASDVPESYFEHQKKIAREQGYGDISITDQLREEHYRILIQDQRDSIDYWLNYFLSSETDQYPVWAKVWAFNGMLKLGKYDSEKRAFTKRSKSQVAPFVELNREALALVMGAITKKVKGEPLQADPEFAELLKTGNFGRLYAWQLHAVKSARGDLSITDGRWVKYEKGSNPNPNEELTNDELRFLYEIDEQIEGFGYDKDPRVAEIIERRGSIKKDLSRVLGFRESEISTTLEEALSGGIEYHHGDLVLENMRTMPPLPRRISGDLIGYATSIDGWILPEYVGGSFIFQYLEGMKNVVFPRYVGGNLQFPRLKTATEVVLPEIVRGSVDLLRIEDVSSVTFPKEVGSFLELDSVTRANNVTFPEVVGNILGLYRLISAEKVTFPRQVGVLRLDNLEEVHDVKWPESVEKIFLYRFGKKHDAVVKMVPAHLIQKIRDDDFAYN